jgi:hypothetical protein
MVSCPDRKVISVLRREADIQRLVYVSCDARAASQNFVDLGRPESNQYPGEPFVPTRAVPVDLYPLTDHVELVLLFERVSLATGVPRVAAPEPVPRVEEVSGESLAELAKQGHIRGLEVSSRIVGPMIDGP